MLGGLITALFFQIVLCNTADRSGEAVINKKAAPINGLRTIDWGRFKVFS